jgi:hypothetical protein
MQRLEGRGTPGLYIGRTVLKGKYFNEMQSSNELQKQEVKWLCKKRETYTYINKSARTLKFNNTKIRCSR